MNDIGVLLFIQNEDLLTWKIEEGVYKDLTFQHEM